jgi:S-DNA-T family DNA segregation ATPase FtsK/SpoIIIE
MRKIAFLVANDTFPEDKSNPRLHFPKNDAQTLAEVLKEPESCGFEAEVYLNKTSREILRKLEKISSWKELSQDDTLLFYYSGHGKLSGNELCLLANDTETESLRATSVRASDVLGFLQQSRARRRILILDCCHSGAIVDIYKGGDADSALDGLAHSFGTCILSASTAIQLAEEREKDGHGVFTKALIDCLREPAKELITVDDWYDFAFRRLKFFGNQTPRIRNSREGDPIEMGDYINPSVSMFIFTRHI